MSVGRPEASRFAFNYPTMHGEEQRYVQEALSGGHYAADGPFTQRVEEALQNRLGAPRVLLTNSCTAALEIAALLTIAPGDEVIVPSFTYVTSASAFARNAANLVFVDIRPDSLNIDPEAVKAAITPRTKVIVAVHYGGIACDMDALRQIADEANVILVEDAAHAFGASYRGRPLGTFGQLSTLSFHETKNIMAGEGGALVINDPKLAARAQVIRDRGTNRGQFLRGDVQEYNWVDLGSAYAPSDIIAAFLLAQIEEADKITERRLHLWERYHAAFEPLEHKRLTLRPVMPGGTVHNGHIYRLIVADRDKRSEVLAELNRRGFNAVFHYTPLHLSQAGLKYGRTNGALPVTEDMARRLVRLPLHLAMGESDQDEIIQATMDVLRP